MPLTEDQVKKAKGDFTKTPKLPARGEYKPLGDARMVEAIRRSKELKDAGESLYND